VLVIGGFLALTLLDSGGGSAAEARCAGVTTVTA